MSSRSKGLSSTMRQRMLLLLNSIGDHWQFDPEPAAHSAGRAHADAPSHQLDRLTSCCQTQSDARISFDAMQLRKRFEEFMLLGRCNANAVILDVDAHSIDFAVRVYLHARVNAGGSELEGIGKDVHQ